MHVPIYSIMDLGRERRGKRKYEKRSLEKITESRPGFFLLSLPLGHSSKVVGGRK
jgi:hypothetical protein